MPNLSLDGQITFLYTQSMDKSLRFYEDHLKLPLVLDQGGCRIYSVVDQAYLGICERPEQRDPTGVIFTLLTSDVDAMYNHLKAKGVEFLDPPQINHTYGIYHCFAKDPNGYLIEIQRFLDPDWNKDQNH
jgi:catechol 2,3-dioxygenase-like lactoylglutathione lyase family enzyme